MLNCKIKKSKILRTIYEKNVGISFDIPEDIKKIDIVISYRQISGGINYLTKFIVNNKYQIDKHHLIDDEFDFYSTVYWHIQATVVESKIKVDFKLLHEINEKVKEVIDSLNIDVNYYSPGL